MVGAVIAVIVGSQALFWVPFILWLRWSRNK
jgi:hypothetical protein